jgi:hypothetical protein
MKLGLLKRIPKEQLAKSGDLPKWIDALLDPLNEFIEKVGLALQARLTFEDNFLCKVAEQKIVDGLATEINPYRDATQKNLKVIGVMVLSSGSLLVESFGWVRKTNGNIDVTINYASGTEALCRLLILLG